MFGGAGTLARALGRVAGVCGGAWRPRRAGPILSHLHSFMDALKTIPANTRNPRRHITSSASDDASAKLSLSEMPVPVSFQRLIFR